MVEDSVESNSQNCILPNSVHSSPLPSHGAAVPLHCCWILRKVELAICCFLLDLLLAFFIVEIINVIYSEAHLFFPS